MVNSLTEYVRAQLQRGYPPESIRTALIQAGYNPQDIDFALRIAVPARRIELTGRNLAMVAGGILTVILLIVSAFIIFSAGSKDLQMSIRVEQPQLLPGDTLSFSATFTSAQRREVPVALNYVISEPLTRKLITSRSERVMVGESSFTTKSIPLPDNLAPNEYEIKLTAQFEGLTRIQTAKFTVQQPVASVEATPTEEQTPKELELTELPCPASCDDLNPATADSCERGTCIHQQLENVCGNNQCEDGENKILCPEDCGAAQDKSAVHNQALQFATSDPEKAATLCNSLVIPENADPCFAAIANVSQKSALCTNIQDERARDRCLMEFAFTGDYSVCNQLSNRYFLTSCQSLSRLSTARQEQAAAEAEAEQIAQEIVEE